MTIQSLLSILLPRLRAAIAFLAALTAALQPALPQAEAETYRYLAIGNSITRHPVCDIWWSEAGMAASCSDRDYYHLVVDYLLQRHENVDAAAVNYVEWEITEDDRASTYPVIDPYLTKDLDLITLQLSENVQKGFNFEKTYAELIRHIQKKCPHADIILVDDFWSKPKSRSKQKTADRLGVPFADLSAIRGNPAFMSSVGSTVYDAEGQPHVIEREDVARHPNDYGMAFIAQAIIAQIEALDGSYSVNPPSTVSVWPVIKAAPSLSRKSAAQAISPGVHRRPSGVSSASACLSAAE